jgi:3',5'-cyclic AMP phosphodiesterase CpdA
MPGILYTPTSRRNFLKFTATTGAAVAFSGCATTSKVSTHSAPFHLALLSDTHIPADKTNAYRGFKPWDNLSRIAPEVAATSPEGVILCGDAARLEGYKEDYQQLQHLLEPITAKAPVYVALGNHDDRANFKSVVPASGPALQKIADKHVLLIDHPTISIIILDSLLYVNKVPGLLGNAQRKWLSDYLAAHNSKPVAIFVHHTLGENDGDLLDAPRLFDLLRPHKQVKAIFFGHSHVWSIKQQEHLQLINLPAVGYNFRDTDPVGWVSARFASKGVDLTMHAFAGNTALDGSTAAVRWLA